MAAPKTTPMDATSWRFGVLAAMIETVGLALAVRRLVVNRPTKNPMPPLSDVIDGGADFAKATIKRLSIYLDKALDKAGEQLPIK